ncbi:MAG: universal stress protein [Candidatus Korobacteraceae bacterium]
MHEPRPLQILFLTSFSDSCYRAIPALAQMADDLEVRITLLHSYDPEQVTADTARCRVQSFFPEADRFGIVRRLAMPGKLPAIYETYRAENPVDLIFAPSSDPLGRPRLGHPIRSRMIRESGVPVWTIGPKVDVRKLQAPNRSVACWIDFEHPDKTHLKLAFEYAWKLDAQLHLLHVLPEVNESTVLLPLYYDKPLHAEGATEEIRKMLGWVPMSPEIHVTTGNARKGILRLAKKCDADILFVGKGTAIESGFLGTRLNPAIDQCHCPVICVDGNTSSMAIWKLDRGSAFLSRTAPRRIAKVGR